jgi:hypothetical protein
MCLLVFAVSKASLGPEGGWTRLVEPRPNALRGYEDIDPAPGRLSREILVRRSTISGMEEGPSCFDVDKESSRTQRDDERNRIGTRRGD